MRRALWLALPWLLAGCTVALGSKPRAADQFAAPASSGVALEVLPIRMGSVSAPPCAPAGEASCLGSFQVVHTAFLIKHPRMTFLFEASLSSSSTDDLKRFGIVDRAALGFTQEDDLKSAMARLQRAGWAAPERVVVSHAHWDHTGGLVDLMRPKVVLGPGEAEYLKNYPADKPPIAMPHHVANATLETFAWDGPAFENFDRSHDFFGDGSVVFVPLPGHTPGSIGVFLSTVRGQRVLFVGDTAWSSAAIELPSHRLKPLSKLADSDTTVLSDSLWRLNRLHQTRPELLIVPTHDGRAVAELTRLATTPVGFRGEAP